ncbi:MAG: inorganic phosphate transporter [Bacteroidales bacterium]|nr:inorganic phosphate transporter [Bacteroidales bacterium]
MEALYLGLVVVLALLAVSDLVVGVSNDAVNFLNSAVGSKAAPLKLILFIASIGVVVGATFSSGLMEIARKGIFNPEQFYFNEVMIIFVAVMVTDVILLDIYNTFGLPTSTTVSLIFELLGASVAIALFKIAESETFVIADLGNYINTAKALAIISGILISIFIAFFVGTIIQYISRLLFSFNFKRSIKYFGALWGGLAITAIVYFILIKGAKGASFLSEANVQWIKTHTWIIMISTFVGLTVLFQVLQWLFKVNSLKVIVLVGTFALAMSFAGNDLVNFIGVPMAGLASYQEYVAQGSDQILMSALSEPVKVNTYLLLLAGLIMVLSLWTSKKAKAVTATEVNLGRQYEGTERFSSTGFSRTVVRMTISLNQTFDRITPGKVKRFIEKRFENPRAFLEGVDPKDAPSFDMIRASVNLVVASTLIALGTSLKLPLSTTYVTFMVAMATSLSDRAWGKDSAVYRVTGVFIVIAGWFLTAITAFLLSAIFASILHLTGPIGTIILVGLAVFSVIRTQVIFRRREKVNTAEKDEIMDSEHVTEQRIIDNCTTKATTVLETVPVIIANTYEGLSGHNLKDLKKADSIIKMLNEGIKQERSTFPLKIEKFPEAFLESGTYYIQVLDYLKEVGNCLTFIAKPSLEHVDNNHQEILDIQKEELSYLAGEIREYFNEIISQIHKEELNDNGKIHQMEDALVDQIEKIKKKQIKRIRNGESKVRNSMLYLNVLEESRKLVIYTHSVIKALDELVKTKS